MERVSAWPTDCSSGRDVVSDDGSESPSRAPTHRQSHTTPPRSSFSPDPAPPAMPRLRHAALRRPTARRTPPAEPVVDHGHLLTMTRVLVLFDPRSTSTARGPACSCPRDSRAPSGGRGHRARMASISAARSREAATSSGSLRSDSASARSRARRWARSASSIAVLAASERDRPSLVNVSNARSTSGFVRIVSVVTRQRVVRRVRRPAAVPDSSAYWRSSPYANVATSPPAESRSVSTSPSSSSTSVSAHAYTATSVLSPQLLWMRSSAPGSI
jgi:hypothetical protein